MPLPNFDTWGDVQIPTTGALPFTPIFTSAWVTPATVPVADPTLAICLDFLATFCVTDAMVTAAWAPVAGAAGNAAIKRIFPHNPEEVVFNVAHLPALYLWRESSKQEYFADDWLMDVTALKGLWVYPLAQQANQRARAPVVNALAKAMGVAIERGRTVSWVQPGDPESAAATLGSLFYTYANFEAFWLDTWRASKLLVPAADRTATDAYPAVEFSFVLREKLDYGLGRFQTYTGATDTVSITVYNTFPTWLPATFYKRTAYVVPPASNGNYYVCTSPGTTGATQPLWPLAPGASVTDGQVTWQCVGPTVYVRWAAATAYPLGGLIVPATANQHYYEATTPGITGATAPTFPTTPGATVTDGTVVWTCIGFTSELAVSGPLETSAPLPV